MALEMVIKVTYPEGVTQDMIDQYLKVITAQIEDDMGEYLSPLGFGHTKAEHYLGSQ